MNRIALCIVLVFALNAAATADEPQSSLTFIRYLVTVSEYQPGAAIAADATAEEIVDFIQNEQLTPLETIRLSAIDDVEGSVNFGRRVTVTTGKSVSQGQTLQQKTSEQVGTQLQVLVSPHEEGVIAIMTFGTSRHVGEGTDDSPPDIVNIRVSTKQLFEFGKPQLIGSTSAGETSYIVATITQLP